jgi:hypothetical protein
MAEPAFRNFVLAFWQPDDGQLGSSMLTEDAH